MLSVDSNGFTVSRLFACRADVFAVDVAAITRFTASTVSSNAAIAVIEIFIFLCICFFLTTHLAVCYFRKPVEKSGKTVPKRKITVI